MKTSQRISFAGARGNTLAVRFDMSKETPRAFALFAHCFTCSREIHAARRVEAGLAERGIAVL